MGRARRPKSSSSVPSRFVSDKEARVAGVAINDSGGQAFVFSPRSGALYTASISLEDCYDHRAEKEMHINSFEQIEGWVRDRVHRDLIAGRSPARKLDMHIDDYDRGDEETEMSGVVFVSDFQGHLTDPQDIIVLLRSLGPAADPEILIDLLRQKDEGDPEDLLEIQAYEMGVPLVHLPRTFREVLLQSSSELQSAGLGMLSRKRSWAVEHDIRFLEAEARRKDDLRYLQKAQDMVSRLFQKALRLEKQSLEMAPLLHEAWRGTRSGSRWQSTEDPAWIKKHGSSSVDIASLAYEDLPEDWKEENRAAARAALMAIENAAGHSLPEFRTAESVGESIYRERCRRLGLEGVPRWDDLSEEERLKDIIQVRVLLSHSDRFFLNDQNQIATI